jgi:hypothetical protein
MLLWSGANQESQVEQIPVYRAGRCFRFSWHSRDFRQQRRAQTRITCSESSLACNETMAYKLGFLWENPF